MATSAALFLAGSSEAAEPATTQPTIQSIQVATGRRIEYLKLGAEHGTPLVLIHGFLGSGNIYSGMHNQLKENGMSAIAPFLYGNGTDWQQRNSVMDAGKDIGALAQKVFPGVMPRIVGCSGGVKDAIAACLALNQGAKDKVPDLFLASGQTDLSKEAFQYLTPDDQFKLSAIRGTAKGRLFPEIGGRVIHKVAQKRLAKTAGTSLAPNEILSKMPRVDLDYLNNDRTFKDILVNDAIGYSYPEVLDSLNRMHCWNLDFIHRVNVESDISMLI